MMYEQLMQAINDYLKPYEINAIDSDIFEELLLLAAGVKNKPISCKFNKYKTEMLSFTLEGITESDALLFLKFLKENDETADIRCDTSYWFKVRCDKALGKLVPLFIETFQQQLLNEPQKIDEYKRQCQVKEQQREEFRKKLEQKPQTFQRIFVRHKPNPFSSPANAEAQALLARATATTESATPTAVPAQPRRATARDRFHSSITTRSKGKVEQKEIDKALEVKPTIQKRR